MTATRPDTTGHFQSHYIPNTTDEQAEMLAALGIVSIDQLFIDIPDEYRNPTLELPAPLSELEIQRELGGMAAKNRPLGSGPSFLGAGSYDHFIPSIIKPLITRGEFITAYTPYQAEASQGTLQVIYEFQTLICNLYGMEVANAGMYDGATSLAEAVLMACRVAKREKVALVDTVSPAYSAVIHTYCQSQDIAVETVSPSNVVLDDETACLVLQYPNYFGNIEDMQNLIDVAHAQGALAVVSTDPTAMGMFQTPGHYGADIVTGDGQPLGIPSSFGGPFVGLFATKQEYIRQMPSRLSGRTVDKNGKTGYVLTLQTREQHIRRERATSNICTNEALYALASTIYLAAMGKQGLRQVAELCYHKAHYAAAKIGELPGYSLPIDGPFFQEFVVQCPSAPADINKKLMEQNILGGLDVSERVPNGMLLCVTEMSSRDDINALVAALSEFK
ncbi:MAG: aminomethyl-transferring glycine dehydrogenase subunit GcvPA [Chloroflexota bacterium]|jgi:glycine dehydrogenase subunit 1|nr:aminomethyl-transferring glycine dehydrogenase subunit GcvPA [Dehalococcoidia bacterium]MEC8909584.1 aminomethyl-transferring glycine dehydrogenase subunit GcvPA [Chloroflexota bacterium]PKB62473.1 MAG: glycine dehydrogenase (aminomethyl-transferring) [SAR202 cluster bacterium Ae2-Chloro-G3]MEC9445172.1 aminomethyl-transferring glycine dehydrogenase subunit GcvPA [Chloroflexota bacterium]MED5404569.1 aminomethyl-transferring glycine dehydrogenase subunit GcvPA [Chloroflexota bacterium]|tara:strand:+ start:449 stop:1789 length:1341 start_codon:yes stop_codon:yes gene_type:complete